MNRARLALTGVAVAMVMNFGLTTAAGAAALFYNMTLTPTSGSITTIGTGSFSINSLMFSGIGIESFGSVGGSLYTPGLLSFNISSASPLINLSISDDDNYPNFPRVTFVNGVFNDASYEVTSTLDSQFFRIAGSGFTYEYIDPLSDVFTGGGDVSVSAVPLPAALPLFLSGLAGIGLIGRKRRKRDTGALADSPA